jgi:hypothetical protein
MASRGASSFSFIRSCSYSIASTRTTYRPKHRGPRRVVRPIHRHIVFRMFDYVHNSQNHQPGDTACQKYCYAAPRAPSEGEGVEGGVPRYTGGERAD